MIITSFQRSGNPSNKDCLPGIKGQGGVKDKVRVTELPRSDLDRLVLDGRGAHAEVELVLVLDALLDQSLHGALVLIRYDFKRKLRQAFYSVLTWNRRKA